MTVLKDHPLSEIRKYINWTQFFVTWEIRGKYPQIFDDPKKGNEAKKLFQDANTLLDKIEADNLLQANAVIGIFRANSEDDDIIIYDKNGHEIEVFQTLRQQNMKKSDAPNLSLSDYIAPLESGRTDYIGLFANTAGIGIEKLTSFYDKQNDDYNSLMVKIIADRLAEAFAELLHFKVRREYWGYDSVEEENIKDFLSEKYSGIRPAVGYPSLPDHTENKKLFKLLGVS